jgi:Leucine-rich repeat (LRR) protein
MAWVRKVVKETKDGATTVAWVSNSTVTATEFGELCTYAFNPPLSDLGIMCAELPPTLSCIGELGASLRKLEMSHCDIISLPSSISRLVGLRDLYLNNNNGLAVLPSELCLLPALRLLCVSNTAITGVPALQHVTHLYVSNTNITAFPTGYPVLTDLDISSNRGYELVPMVQSLHVLHMDNMELSVLPGWIGEYTLLLSLSFDKNGLDAIPSSIGKLSLLRHLSMRDNNIETLPTSLWDLSQLTGLNLANNNLSHIPNQIGNLVSLAILNVSGNTGLKNLPYTIYRATKLFDISIGNTSIVSLPASALLLPRISTNNTPPLYWHTRYHLLFPEEDKRMILAVMLCNERAWDGTIIVPYLPREMLWAIFTFIEYVRQQ